jgi:hypothetical protein
MAKLASAPLKPLITFNLRGSPHLAVCYDDCGILPQKRIMPHFFDRNPLLVSILLVYVPFVPSWGVLGHIVTFSIERLPVDA